jgi:hypothetical protein
MLSDQPKHGKPVKGMGAKKVGDLLREMSSIRSDI